MGSKTQSTNNLIREFSSGGVVYKKVQNKTLWLVRQTSASDLFPKTYWALPKGWLDDAGNAIPGPIASGKVKATEDLLQSTAIREVAEEGGIEARIVQKIGTIRYVYSHPKNGKVLKFVTFYLMEWVSDLPEGFDEETSEVAWLPFKKALERLSFDRERETLSDAYKLLPR